MIPKASFIIRALRLLILFAIPFASASARADLPPGQMTFGGLVVSAGPQLRLTGRNQADYEFGRICPLDTDRVEHVFTLHNDGKEIVTIMQLQPSCHCTTVVVEPPADRKLLPSEDFLPEVPPGGDIKIKVTVQLARQVAGPLSHGVFVFVNGIAGPVARLHLTGELETGIRVTPAIVDFGPMKVGETRSAKMAIAFDSRLTAGSDLPPIANHCELGAGTKVGAIIEITPETGVAAEEVAAPASTRRVKTYMVTIRPTRTGDMFAQFFFAPLSASDYKGSVAYDTAMEVFSGMRVMIRGQVTE
jgi:Protein of unknown function (DUF1573)